MEPLQKAGFEGTAMTSGDGNTCWCHPIFALFMGNYPEHILDTGVRMGQCPWCECPKDDLEDGEEEYEYRGLGKILDALSAFDDLDTQIFVHVCSDAGIKPVVLPFWENLPYTNIYQSITPDVLPQLYQGVIKHLLVWVKSAFGEAEIDAWSQQFPPNHNIHLFMNGTTSLSQLSGTKYSQICQLVLSMVVDLCLPNGMNSLCLICAVHAILDFLYLAQYHVHSSTTLDLLANSLSHFLENKNIFIDFSVQEHFNIQKLHYLKYYMDFIKLHGTTDNYGTKYTEHLYIDLPINQLTGKMNIPKWQYGLNVGKSFGIMLLIWSGD